jgi:hypothetical protein
MQRYLNVPLEHVSKADDTVFLVASCCTTLVHSALLFSLGHLGAGCRFSGRSSLVYIVLVKLCFCKYGC